MMKKTIFQIESSRVKPVYMDLYTNSNINSINSSVEQRELNRN